MTISIGKYLLGGVVVLLCGVSVAVAAEQNDGLTPLYEGVPEYWSSAILPQDAVILPQDAVIPPSEAVASNDQGVTPAQMLTPQARTAQRSSAGARRSSVARRNPNLASVPFMIGDTGAGTCLSFGGLLDVELSHPTLTCSRLNISENNSPLPTDRLYFSYRHFHNATPTRVFQFNRDFHVDRFTLGGERTFFDGMLSCEIRCPLEGRLNSNVFTELRTDLVPPIVDPIAGGTFAQFEGLRRAELGNLSLVFKALLHESNDCAISAGVAFTLPTARDVNYGVDIVDSFTFNGFPTITADQDILLDLAVSNESVYIAPFLAWLMQPNPRFYHQGFLQVEVAANPSNVRVIGDGISEFFDGGASLGVNNWFVPFPGRTELFAQSLLRLNLGLGYVLMEDPRATWVQKLTGIFETHYSTTLEDANISTVEVIEDFGFGVQSIEIGNRNNRIDIVNLVAGFSADVGNMVITNGFTAPITTGSNRGFDFEYNLQVQRPF